MMVLGIDYGSKKVGLALLDTDTEIVFPLKTVLNKKELLQEIVTTAKQYRIVRIVLGKPSAGSIIKKIQRFAQSLKAATSIDVDFITEDLSSRYAHSMLSSLRENNAISIKGYGKKDTFSATVILEEWQTNIKSKQE
jgi:putative Holliday junction resolvase